MKVRVREENDVCVIDCEGQLTYGGNELKLRDALRTALDGGKRKIVLNYSGLANMDSAGVGETVACAKRALERAGVVKIVIPEAGLVPRIFAVTCLDRAFEIFVDEEKAVGSFWR